MTDTQAIAYRRMVASLARELSVEEVAQVAYIRLTGLESICKYTSNPPTATGLDLLATLERLGVFSQKDTKGLVDIAKDINRRDLAGRIEEYRKNPPKAVKYRRKKQRGLPSEERQKLEETFEMMVTQFAVLEQHVSLLQRALDEEQDEALEVLRVTGMVVQDMGTKLNDVHKTLARRSIASSNSSGGDSRPNSGEVSSLLDDPQQQPTRQDHVSNLTAQTQLHQLSPSQQRRRKPIPLPRKPPNQCPPIQETAEQSSVAARLQPPMPVECEDDKKSHRTHSVGKPPIRPRRRSLRSGSLYSVNPQMNYHMPEVKDAVDSEEDVTGDSGMGTGSSSAQYGSVEAWKQAINIPPADSREHNYEPISARTRDPDLLYQDLRRKPRQ